MKEMVLKHTQGYIQDSGLGGRGGGGQCNTGMYRCTESGGGGILWVQSSAKDDCFW